jgi:hypothetical protein
MTANPFNFRSFETERAPEGALLQWIVSYQVVMLGERTVKGLTSWNALRLAGDIFGQLISYLSQYLVGRVQLLEAIEHSVMEV